MKFTDMKICFLEGEFFELKKSLVKIQLLYQKLFFQLIDIQINKRF